MGHITKNLARQRKTSIRVLTLWGGFIPPGIFLRGIFIQDGSTKIFLHAFE